MQHSQDFYINGQWVAPLEGRPFNVINPSNEEIAGTISLGGKADTDAAVAAAKAAFTSWRRSAMSERMDLLETILGIYKRRANDMAEAISIEMGAPIDMAKVQQAGAGSGHLQAFINALKDFKFEGPMREDTPDTYLIKEPIGVCALITPWNWPMNQITLKVIPALATGCTMILKPSEQSPLSGLLFSEIMHEAGVPAGVYNMVNGDGPGVGSQLSAHPDVDMVSFTGSTRAGKAITIAGAETIKRVTLELGGKGA
ncbi:MAG: aldehyde dehydrogenase family protein, partial [Pseudomonadota bacterium]|nr:aldehyde dehydrogenase family protein [Pseudomonadota bacterium]